LPQENLVAGSELLIRGPFALEPIYTLGAGDILQLGGRVFGLVGDYQTPSGETFTRIVVPYPDPTVALAAYNHLVTHLDPYLTVVAGYEGGFVFQDYRQEFGLVTLVDEVLTVQIHLASPPGQK
jgi:hypothetical protein